jgi:hypothetical protein
MDIGFDRISVFLTGDQSQKFVLEAMKNLCESPGYRDAQGYGKGTLPFDKI